MALTTATGEKSAKDTDLQEAVRQLIHSSSVPPKAIAEDAGMPLKALYDIASPDRPQLLPLSCVVRLTRAAQNYVLLDYLESKVGRIGIPLPTDAPRSLAETAALFREMGEFVEQLALLSDGALTRADAERIRREGLDVIASTWGLILRARAQAVCGRAPSAGCA